MDFPHFVVLLVILFLTMSVCILVDYMYVDRRQIRRRKEFADVTPFPVKREQKRAA